MPGAGIFKTAISHAAKGAYTSVEKDTAKIKATAAAEGWLNSGKRFKQTQAAAHYRARLLIDEIVASYSRLDRKARRECKALAEHQVREFLENTVRLWRLEESGPAANAALQRLHDDAYVDIMTGLDLKLATASEPESKGVAKWLSDAAREHLPKLIGFAVVVLLTILAMMPALQPYVAGAKKLVKLVGD